VEPTALTVASQFSPKGLGETYLKFELAPGTLAVMSMKSIDEVLALPAQRLTAMPNMPACILGLLNRRNRVLWAVDLAKLLEIGNLDFRKQQYEFVLVRSGNMTLALAMHRVAGMVSLSPDRIQAAPNHAAPGLTSYVRGCVLEGQELSLLLDAETILHSRVLHDQ
jgi:positive phototaxis protein PixI